MFTYYGTKKMIAKYYPVPTKDKIIEPFAGAAQYSLFSDNWKKEVILYDKFDKIVSVWNYLINATDKDILSLPNMEVGQSINDFNYLAQEEKYLIGFMINPASANPKKKVMARSIWNDGKMTIAKNLFKIKHWKAYCLDYKDIPNINATWYIDPPYQKQGIYYRMNSKMIDYNHLGNWCKDRLGQVIVCDNMDADWLDFEPLVKIKGMNNNKTVEAIWYKEG